MISGRRLDDVAKRLEGIPIWYVFGNFGHEPAPHGHRPPARVRDWARRLTEQLPTHRGLVVEEKAYSVTIHYRQVRDKRRALAAIEAAVSEIFDARAIGGTEALTLLPRGGPDQGVALQEARRLFHCSKALYVGDDDTDEDAFASAPADQLLAIRVGTTRRSAARYRLRRQADMDRFLQTLATLSRRGRPAPPTLTRWKQVLLVVRAPPDAYSTRFAALPRTQRPYQAHPATTAATVDTAERTSARYNAR